MSPFAGASPTQEVVTVTKFGLTLSSEEHGPRRLVDLAGSAEESGFDFVSISDHFHPWLAAQGHAPNVWPLLGAISERTESIDVAVGVTCPTVRIHPAILAQLTATVAGQLPGRFVWGVGSGEALNEHILGDRWPSAPERLEMLAEAITVIREMWSGETVSFDGKHYRVDHARIFDTPPHPIPIVVSAFGPRAAELAAEHGDGLWTTGTDGMIDEWKQAGGEGPVYSQLTFCWGEDRESALDTVERVWPNSAVPGQLSQDLPTPEHFEMATSIVTREMLAEQVHCGPDLDPLVDQIEAAVDAGVDHLYLHQIGDDQEGFLQVWREVLAERVRS
jgi:coenzyme F420-dependent glucose-6-phosphate dehydrogenase